MLTERRPQKSNSIYNHALRIEKSKEDEERYSRLTLSLTCLVGLSSLFASIAPENEVCVMIQRSNNDENQFQLHESRRDGKYHSRLILFRTLSMMFFVFLF